MAKKPVYSMTVSQARNDKKNWALHLSEGRNQEKEETMVFCQFTRHPMMDEDSMNEMMGELAHMIVAKYHDYQQRKKEANRHEKIAKGVVKDFFNRIKRDD